MNFLKKSGNEFHSLLKDGRYEKLHVWDPEPESCEECKKAFDSVNQYNQIILNAIRNSGGNLKETMEDTKEEMYKSQNEDAKTGYKSAETSFFWV